MRECIFKVQVGKWVACSSNAGFNLSRGVRLRLGGDRSLGSAFLIMSKFRHVGGHRSYVLFVNLLIVLLRLVILLDS